MVLLDYIDYQKMFWDLLVETLNGKKKEDYTELEKKLADFRRDANDSCGDLEYMGGESWRDKNIIHICYGESGGQNESDSQGWSRNYLISFDYKKEVFKDCHYEQG